MARPLSFVSVYSSTGWPSLVLPKSDFVAFIFALPARGPDFEAPLQPKKARPAPAAMADRITSRRLIMWRILTMGVHILRQPTGGMSSIVFKPGGTVGINFAQLISEATV